MLNKTGIPTTLLLLLAGSYAMADTITVCKKGTEQRSVSIVYAQTNSKVPCEVKYTKGGSTQSLWNYQHETGKCEGHASEFIAKLQGIGWTCAGQEAGPAPNPAMIDESIQPAK